MTPQTTAALLARLEARERELRRDVSRDRERLVPAGDDGVHEVRSRGDEAAARADQVVLDGEFERDLAELRAIATARQRAAEGRYGLCIACDAPIEPARLEAQPAALRCLECQRAAERRRG